jgi:hypothetical protein
MRRSALLVVIVALGLGASAHAAVVAPSKASQLVTLRPTGGCPDGGVHFDTRVNADGTETAFSIPENQVLVLDHLAWQLGGGAGVTLEIGSTIIWSDSVTLTAPNVTPIGNSVALPNIAVASGKIVCIDGGGGQVNTTITRLHGFLAKDK